MVVERRKKRIYAYLSMKAVDGSDQSIYGIVRMGGDVTTGRKVDHVKGICAFFEQSQDKLYLNENDLFFYGTLDDLAKMYYRDLPDEINLSKYRDKSKNYSSPKPGSRYDFMFISIPINEMNLREDQTSFVGILTQNARRWLSGLDIKQNLVKVDTNTTKGKRVFGKYFASFPSELRDEALQKGFFYSSSTPKYRSISDYISTPNIIIISTPMGGLPEWAKKYMRSIKA